MKSKTIFKTSVKDFAKHCQEVVYISRTFRQNTQLHFTTGYMHLCGYDKWGNPIALISEVYYCPPYQSTQESSKFDPKFEEIKSYLGNQGLEIEDGTFQFGDNFVLGTIGSLDPEPPVSTEENNPFLPKPNPAKPV